ncbi:MAG: LysR substrate-binding domain-containing protein, partial [Pseudomonadota bacterium]
RVREFQLVGSVLRLSVKCGGRADVMLDRMAVFMRDLEQAERELIEYASDMALVFEPLRMVDFEVVFALSQPIHVVMRASHPLAEHDTLRIRDCLRFPHVAPAASYAVRILLDAAAKRTSSSRVNPFVESESFDFMRHYGAWEDVLSFQFPIGLNLASSTDLVSRPLSTRDVPPGNLLLGQLRGRTLPVASARFAQQLVNSLQATAS